MPLTFPNNLTSLDPRFVPALAESVSGEYYPVNVANTPQFQITLYNNAYEPLGDITDYISAQFTWKRNGVGTGTIVLPGTSAMAPYALNCWYTVVPVIVEADGQRWSGRVDTCSDDVDDKGVNTVTLQLLHDWNWLNKILCWQNPFLPIEVQFPQISIFAGPAITTMMTMLFEQAIRLQLGLWEIVNNILDVPAWFATAISGDGLLTPIAVVPVDPLTDTSPWVAYQGTMSTSCGDLIQAVCQGLGVTVYVEMWMPGDPQPTDVYSLSVPTVVVSFADNSGVNGPTGTFLDGLIIDIYDLTAGAFNEATVPFIDSPYSPAGVALAAVFGIDYTPPWVVFDGDNPRAGIKEFTMLAHHPLAFTVVGGGKSPSWVNQLINLVLEGLLSLILSAVGLSGVTDTLLDGIFNNVVLAWQEIENAGRRFNLGTYGYPEYFVGTGSTAYTLDEFFALFNGMWDSRGYWTCKVTVYNNEPYTYGLDFNLGTLVSWIRRGQVWSDYVDEATVIDTRKERVVMTCTIGDGKTLESVWAILQRRLKVLQDALEVSLLAQN